MSDCDHELRKYLPIYPLSVSLPPTHSPSTRVTSDIPSRCFVHDQSTISEPTEYFTGAMMSKAFVLQEEK